MNGIGRWESKWYSRNNRRHWCTREAAVIAVHDRVGSTAPSLFCMCRPGARMVALWSSSRRLCARRAAKSVPIAQSCTTTIARRSSNLLRGRLRLQRSVWLPDGAGEWPSSASPWRGLKVNPGKLARQSVVAPPGALPLRRVLAVSGGRYLSSRWCGSIRGRCGGCADMVHCVWPNTMALRPLEWQLRRLVVTKPTCAENGCVED